MAASQNKLRVVVLISGRGSNLRALIKACKDADFPAKIVKVISNIPKAAGLEHARKAKIETAVVAHKDFNSRAEFEAALDAEIKSAQPGLICLAGFMRLLSPQFVNAWRDRLINIHPSLLPAFKGLHTHERAIEAGVKITGCTVHYVRPETDDGPIIIQAALAVRSDDTAETLAARVLKLEHQIYPQAVRLIALGRVKVKGRIAEITDGKAPRTEMISPKG